MSNETLSDPILCVCVWEGAKRVNPVLSEQIWSQAAVKQGALRSFPTLTLATSFSLTQSIPDSSADINLSAWSMLENKTDKRFKSHKTFSQTVQLFVSAWTVFLLFFVFFSLTCFSLTGYLLLIGAALFWGWLVCRIIERLLAWLHWNVMQMSSQGQAMANWKLTSVQITDRRTVEADFCCSTAGCSRKTANRSKNITKFDRCRLTNNRSMTMKILRTGFTSEK